MKYKKGNMMESLSKSHLFIIAVDETLSQNNPELKKIESVYPGTRKAIKDFVSRRINTFSDVPEFLVSPSWTPGKQVPKAAVMFVMNPDFTIDYRKFFSAQIQMCLWKKNKNVPLDTPIAMSVPGSQCDIIKTVRYLHKDLNEFTDLEIWDWKYDI